MSDEKCFRCGALATRQRQVVVRSVDREHPDLFPEHHGLAHRGGGDRLLHHHDGHHHHREVVRELRHVCEACSARIDAEEAALAKVAVGVLGGAALMVLIPVALVSIGILGAAGTLIWFFLR